MLSIINPKYLKFPTCSICHACRRMLRNENFENINELDLAALSSFKNVFKHFFGKIFREDFVEMQEK